MVVPFFFFFFLARAAESRVAVHGMGQVMGKFRGERAGADSLRDLQV